MSEAWDRMADRMNDFAEYRLPDGETAIRRRVVHEILNEHRPLIEAEARADCETRLAALRVAARDLYTLAVGEHGHDETHSADWPACLPAHIAMNRYRAALATDPVEETT